MASVAESVARLTHPSSQTGRGSARIGSATFERGEWAIGNNGHEETVTGAASLPVDRKPAILASPHESSWIIVYGSTDAEPARSLELDPRSGHLRSSLRCAGSGYRDHADRFERRFWFNVRCTAQGSERSDRNERIALRNPWRHRIGFRQVQRLIAACE